MRKWQTIIDLEISIKRGLYNTLNRAKGRPLLWDSKKRRYVAHVDLNMGDDGRIHHVKIGNRQSPALLRKSRRKDSR